MNDQWSALGGRLRVTKCCWPTDATESNRAVIADRGHVWHKPCLSPPPTPPRRMATSSRYNAARSIKHRFRLAEANFSTPKQRAIGLLGHGLHPVTLLRQSFSHGKCVITSSAVAPCQCRVLGGIQTISPGPTSQLARRPAAPNRVRR